MLPRAALPPSFCFEVFTATRCVLSASIASSTSFRRALTSFQQSAAKRLRAYHAYSLAEYGVAEADVDGAFAAYYAAHLPGARA